MFQKNNPFFLLTLLILLASTSIGFTQTITDKFIPVKQTVEDKLLIKKVHEFTVNQYITEFNNYSTKQKKHLKEYYKSREGFFEYMILDGQLIYEGELHKFLQGILNEITNQQNVGHRNLYIVRNDVPNAFNIGDNNVFIHLGLINRVVFKEELIFAIGHELGHNELNHYNSAIIDYTELTINDSINKRLKKINKQEYGRVSSVNKLLIPKLLSNQEKSRTAEDDADSYAYKSLKNNGYNLEKGLELFDHLDNGGFLYDTNSINLVNVLMLNSTGFDFPKALRLNTKSSMGEFKKIKSPLEDLLRTHPFGHEREEKYFIKLEKDIEDLILSEHSDDFEYFQILSISETIVDAIYHMNISKAIFHTFYLLNKWPDNAFCQELMPLLFNFLGYEKIKRHSGKRMDIKAPQYGQGYNELIYFLREISPEKCFAIANIWQRTYQSAKYIDIKTLNTYVKSCLNNPCPDLNKFYKYEKENPENYYLTPIMLRLINDKK